MKKINLLMCSLVIAGLGFTSCSDDDNDSNNNESRIEGTYNLKEVNTGEATDFDEDGDSNIDQMKESSCYNNGKITLRADNTFTYVATAILVNETEGTAGCAEDVTYTGTWEIVEGSGTTAIIAVTYEGENNNDVTLTLTKQGNRLSWEDDNIFSQYPDRNNAGAAIYRSGSIKYVYEK
ncbi:hypothetical protein HYN59_16595 [Flavobacterium album]|uniref:Lipocalin-like domain-containing protein n=1 Tax=Flavobacterium album TaxID=2175091 RepID=A0A2S1R1Y3_9FLAO|nr:hypothetical protein [Flavobacterium album]AWH86627.1 hypothetical protein HYN59_16595 [Flavobacterium album]